MIRRNETQVVIVARFRAREGEQERLLETLYALIQPTRDEVGAIRYELNQQVDDPRMFTFVEKFVDQAAVDLHATSPYLAHLAELTPALAETIEVTYHREILA